MDSELRRLLAELLSGLCVPRSLGVLGAAQEPWDKIIDQLGLVGYFSPEVAEAALEDRFPPLNEEALDKLGR